MTSPSGHRPDDASGGGNPPLTRRRFCNNMLLTSACMLMAASDLKAEAIVPQDYPATYPPLKIEGAEALTPGSSLYFNYPTRTNPAILVRNEEGEYYAYSQKCSHEG